MTKKQLRGVFTPNPNQHKKEELDPNFQARNILNLRIISKQANAELTVKSYVGLGTAFTFSVPVKVQTEEMMRYELGLSHMAVEESKGYNNDLERSPS